MCSGSEYCGSSMLKRGKEEGKGGRKEEEKMREGT